MGNEVKKCFFRFAMGAPGGQESKKACGSEGGRAPDLSHIRFAITQPRACARPRKDAAREGECHEIKCKATALTTELRTRGGK